MCIFSYSLLVLKLVGSLASGFFVAYAWMISRTLNFKISICKSQVLDLDRCKKENNIFAFDISEFISRQLAYGITGDAGMAHDTGF